MTTLVEVPDPRHTCPQPNTPTRVPTVQKEGLERPGARCCRHLSRVALGEWPALVQAGSS
ncbi:MAG TPA: hypothetical protein VFX52_11065 [Nocardioidaceae bacterium]|nr:hypothetical protein [Nocardioidaceae bacterium]